MAATVTLIGGMEIDHESPFAKDILRNCSSFDGRLQVAKADQLAYSITSGTGEDFADDDGNAMFDFFLDRIFIEIEFRL